jgi:hypothetical protein
MPRKRVPNLVKGDALEDAVELIERTILNLAGLDSHPEAISIERNKRIVHKGVMHELDLYVVVNRGTGYEASYIFECKNWQRNVGKIPIGEFEYKIRDTNAQHGFFIARSFAKTAKARAAQCHRMSLINATDTNVDPTVFPDTEVLWEQIPARHNEMLITLDGADTPCRPVSPSDLSMTCDGAAVDTNQFVISLADEIVHEQLDRMRPGGRPEGPFVVAGEKLFDFKNKGLLVNGRMCKSIRLKVTSTQYMLRPRVVSHFDIQNRGRTLSIEALSPTGAAIRLSYVDVMQPAGQKHDRRAVISVSKPQP